MTTASTRPQADLELSGAARYQQLRPIFAPRSLAIVGAKDNGKLFLGSAAVMQALERLGYEGELYLINRNGTPAFGRQATRTVSELGVAVDMAAMAVPGAAIPELMPDLIAAGVKGLTSLASGFSETGAEGAALQEHIVREAMNAGMEIVGPNCLGFVNFIDRVGVWFSGLPHPIRQGSVAIVSQSGGVGDALMEAAHNLGVGLSYLITTGNEPVITASDAIEYLVEDPATKSIVVFAEGLKKPEVFLRAAYRARELGKAIIILKAGASEIGARNAISHTGSLVGDDAVTDALLRQLGVVRVGSLETALSTAQLIAATGPLTKFGVAAVSLSGGSCSIMADSAAARGLDMPDFSGNTVDRLTGVVPPFATIQNPFDVTGAADEYTFEKVLEVVGGQDDIGILAVMCNVPTHQSGATPDVMERLESIARGMAKAPIPAVLLSQTSAHLHPFGRDSVSRAGIPAVLPGIEEGVAALERLIWWSRKLSHTGPPISAEDAPRDAAHVRSLSEWGSRQILEDGGVPLVPGLLAQSADQAVDAWRVLGSLPVAVKVVSADIPHKSDIGAVVLGADDEESVSAAYRAVVEAAATHAPEAAVEGVLLSPMRGNGIELIVGVNRDLQWGPTIVVGLGGVFVEVLRDTSVRVLPVNRSDVEEMITELKGASLLAGYRGQPAANLDAVVDAVLAVAESAVRLGGSLESVEVNPLLATANTAEALDALVVVRG